jgi:hypothetical protein
MPSVGVVRDRLLTGTWLWRTRLTNNGLLRNLAMAMASSFNCFGTNQRRLACGAHLWIKVGCFLHHAPEARVPANHPLEEDPGACARCARELNRSLGRLYASEGRPSIPPEQLLSALQCLAGTATTSKRLGFLRSIADRRRHKLRPD